jgi:hypothetical protein
VDEDGNTCWTNYEEIRGLYTVDSVQKEGGLTPVEYQLVCLGTLQIDNIESPATMTIMVKSPKYYIEHSKSCEMEEINKEVDKCPCCNGYGHVVKSISSNFEKEWGNGNTDNFLQN